MTEITITAPRIGPTCDKCRRSVDLTNNLWEVYKRLPEKLGVLALVFPTRHFLPEVDENGRVLCEGSPSTAQYIEGQPHDAHPDYPYEEHREAEVRAAYAQLQKACAGNEQGDVLRNVPGEGALDRRC